MSIVYATSNNVEQLVGNGLLTALVVLKIQSTEQFVGIVGGRLHGHHSRGMLAGNAVEQCSVEHQVSHFWYQHR